ncbi:hypothetical protein EYR38_001122 [Pleurotus pulmonarius]|nr:hypothetical protein EYR38_001122 [Pleurotus pulmonarius]
MFATIPLSHCILFGIFFLITYPLLRHVYHVVATRLALRHVPGPTSPSAIWGVEWLLYHDSPGVHYVDWHARYGKVVKLIGAFGHPILSITDRRAISIILGEAAYNFPKPHGVRAWFKALVGEGILWIEGKTHHEIHRRHIAPALSQQSVRNFLPVFYETSAIVASHWSKALDQTTFEHAEIEVTHWAGRFALDTIGRAAFSFDFGALSDGPHGLAEALDGLTNNENRLSSFYMRALFWVFPGILKIGKKGNMIRQTKRELGEISSRLLADTLSADDPASNTLLAMMLRSPTGPDMTEEYIVAQMRTIISAAYETVSAVITWVLYELAVHPDLQQQLRDEVSFPGDPSYEQLMNKFPLLDAILLETLRLHPALLENHHVAAQTISVSLSEPLPGADVPQLVIPKGTIISIPVNVLHTDKHIWGPDASMFRPERWSEPSQEKSSLRRELLAFSEGPRSCIGRTFAMVEIKALIITLIRQFSFSSPYDIEAFQSFVIRPRIKGHGSSSLPLLPALALPSRLISARPGVIDCIGLRSHTVANLLGAQLVRNGGAIVRTHEEFYEADFFICNALDDPWVQKLMRQSKVVLHAEWVLQSLDADLLVGVAPYVLDDFFCERNMPRQISHRLDPERETSDVVDPLEVTTDEETEESTYSKKRGHDTAELSAIDIAMHPPKRARVQVDNPIANLAQDPKMNNAVSLHKADTSEKVIPRLRKPLPVLKFYDPDFIYEKAFNSPINTTKKGVNEEPPKAIQGVKTVNPSHDLDAGEPSNTTVNLDLLLCSKESKRHRLPALTRTPKDIPDLRTQINNDAPKAESTQPNQGTTTSGASSTTDRDERAPATNNDPRLLKNNPLSSTTFKRKSKYPVLRFVPHSCACTDRSQTPADSQGESTQKPPTKDDSPTLTFRQKLQEDINHQPQGTPRFSVKALCSSYPRVDSAIFRPGVEHDGKKFRVKYTKLQA